MKEIEVKFTINPDDIPSIQKYLLNQGYVFDSSVLETDYCPDTEEGLLKDNGIILRYRVIEDEYKRKTMLLTCKIDKTVYETYYTFTEIECDSIAQDIKKISMINSILDKYITKEIEGNLFLYENISDIINYFTYMGLPKNRLLIQKKRLKFKNDDATTLICIDELPLKIGYFLEIESTTVDSLVSTEKILSHFLQQRVKDKYGTIIKNYNNQNQLFPITTCLFIK